MPHLEVRLADGSKAVILASSTGDGKDELLAFLARTGIYSPQSSGGDWVALNGGSEYVRYDQIVAVKLTP